MDTSELNSCAASEYDFELAQIAKLTRQLKFPNEDSLVCPTEKHWPSSKKLTTGALCMIYLIFAFLLLAAIGSCLTIYESIYKYCRSNDGNTRKKKSHPNGVSMNRRRSLSKDAALHSKIKHTSISGWLENLKRFFSCFCLLTNGKTLLNTVPTAGDLSCLHGIRFCSQFWIICVHLGSLINILTLSSNRDGTHAFGYIVDTLVLSCGVHSVNAFFLLSGFLNALSFFQGALNNRNINWLYIYAYRFVRVTPVYMIVIGFYTNLLPYMGSGPFWSTYPSAEICSRHWISNLLFWNNFRPLTEQCMSWSWFLSAEMQFFAISPIFLVSLWRRPKIGYLLLGVFFCVSLLANLTLTSLFNLSTYAISTLGIFDEVRIFDAYVGRYLEYYQILYVKPYTRISPYLMGMTLAYYFVKRKQSNSGKNKLVTICLGWAIATCLVLFCLFGAFLKIGSITEIFFNTLVHPLFSLALALVIFLCLTKQGGFVNNFLSHKIFFPLGRLTYSVYLTHFIVLLGYLTSLKAPLDFSITTLILLLGCLMFACYTVAFIVTLLFEYPLSELQKLVFRVSKFR